MIHSSEIKEYISPFLDRQIEEYNICCPLHYFAIVKLNEILLRHGYEIVHPEGMYFLRSRKEFVYIIRDDNSFTLQVFTTLEYSELEELFVEAFNVEYKNKYVLIQGLSRKIKTGFNAPDFEKIKHTLSQSVVSILENRLWNYKEFCAAYAVKGLSTTLGILLYAPPGFGKTFILRSFLNKLILEKDFTVVQVYQRTISKLSLTQLLDSCKFLFPCVLFIEDIDLRFKDRHEANFGESVAGDLLETFEGMHQVENVVLIATSNSVDVIEKALLRPGRFDYLLEIEKPSRHAKELALSNLIEGVDVEIPGELAERLIEESETFAELKGAFQHVVMKFLSTAEFPHFEEISQLTNRWKETRANGISIMDHRKLGLI
ncbi:MAG: AAA family ATPase [Candidatus Dadabacteria bacterium]|nr:AAA family ATPase [Candidatus Dadabacteria bacterium]